MTPTRGRFTLLRFSLILSIITYLDRVAISSAAPVLREELQLSGVQMAWVFSAFTFAYAAFEIPSGWLGDVYGPRKVLTRIVLWWSAFTAATGLAWNFSSLVAARFFFGVGEAGAFPNISRSFARWFPTPERGNAHGVIFMGTRIGGALAPPLVVMLMTWIGWRQTFFIFGAVGVVWCVFWWRWFRDEPAGHPAVNAEELDLIETGRGKQGGHAFQWADLLSWNLTFICLMYFTMGYTLYFNITWLPTYLREVRGFSVQQAGWIAGAVLMTGGICTYAGGRLTDYLVKRYGLKVGRSVGVISLPVAAVLLLGVALTPSPLMAAVLLAATLGVADLGVSSCWSICHDVGGEHAGTVTGAMNTFGNLGGALSPLVVGYALDWWQSWTIPFFVTAGVYVFGGIMTALVNPNKPLRAPSPRF
jgi:MFS transporter, ACS family, glucarate transporter